MRFLKGCLNKILYFSGARTVYFTVCHIDGKMFVSVQSKISVSLHSKMTVSVFSKLSVYSKMSVYGKKHLAANNWYW